ncbi:Lipoprotein [Chitinophaga sp. 180180018-2]|nr:Lipoprotein [Chitinophaga sp. 212800010-3]
MQQDKRKILVRLWEMPVLLFILTLAGLIICLVYEGIWDILSWITLAIPIVLIMKYLYWPRPDHMQK